MKVTCSKCKKGKDCIVLRIGKAQYPLCPSCFNEWLDERDTAVEAAYNKWIKKK